MPSVKKCEVHISGLDLNTKEVMDIVNEMEFVTDDMKRQQFLKDEIALAMNDALKDAKMMIMDDHIATKTIDDATKDTKTYTAGRKKLAERIYGRNSMDTQRRDYRNRHILKLDEYQAMFGVTEDFRKIDGGSEKEKIVYNKVEQIKQKIDVRNLTPEKARQMMKELGEDITNEDRIAYALAAYNEWARRFMLKHGVEVKYHDGYVTKRRYDPNIIEKMDKDLKDEGGWVGFMAKRLDVEKTFGRPMTEAKLTEELTKIKNKILENAEKTRTVSDIGFDGKPKRKRKREFVFKDGDASYDVFNQTSTGSLADQIEQNAWSMANEAVKIHNLGYDHKTVMKKIDNQMVEYYNGLPEGERGKEAPQMWQNYRDARIKQAVADIAGDNTYATTGLTNFGTAVKTAVAVGKLGNTITVALLDPLDTGRQSFYVNGSFMGGFIEYHKNMISTMKQVGLWNLAKGDFAKANELAQQFGVIANFISTDAGMRVSRGEMGTSTGMFGKALDKVGSGAMKIMTLLPQQTSLSKLSSAGVAATTFTDMLKKVKIKDGKIEKGSLNAFELDTLREYKISVKELEVLKDVPMYEAWGGKQFVTPKGVRDYLLFGKEGGDYAAHVKKMSDKLGIKPEDFNDYAEVIADKYSNFVNDFFSRGTPTPELSAKTALFKASGAEGLNVATSLMFQFMDTPVMQLHSTLEMVDKVKRLYGHEDQTVAQAAKQIGLPILSQMGMHATVGAAMYLGYDMIWSALMGKESKAEKLYKGTPGDRLRIMTDVAGRTSVMPFMFEALNNATSPYYNSNALDTISSPSFSIMSDVADVINPNSNTTLEKFAKRQMPNAWFVQAINNRL